MRVTSLTAMLGVSDVEISISFYSELFGFRVDSSFTPPGHARPSWARLVAGGAELMLTSHGISASSPQAIAAHADAHLYLMTDDLLVVRERAVRLGWVVAGPCVRFYGIKEIEVADPDGYTVVVGELTDEPPTRE